MNKQQLEDSLAKTAKDLMLKEPFYGLFLIQLNKYFSDNYPTAAVILKGINFDLAVNPMFWESLTSEYKLGIIKHELLHIVFNHLTFFAPKHSDKKLSNIAADMEINQYIEPTWLPSFDISHADFKEKYDPIGKQLAEDYKAGILTRAEYSLKIMTEIPARGVYLQDYAELNLIPKGGTDYYYEKLQEAKEQKQQTGSSGSPALDSLLDQMGDDEPTICDHPSWAELEEMDEATQKLIQKQIEHQLTEVAEQVKKSRGTVPGEIAELLSKLQNEPAKFDWKGYLRRFAGGSQKIYTKKLRRKFNKRYEENPGLKIKPKRHILVAIDTSGSVDIDELKEFINEVDHIFRTGADVTIVQCDAAIRNIAPYKRGLEVEIHGRGGTAFDPVVEYYNAHQNKYTCLVYFTDGECHCSEIPRGRTLWVLSSISQMNKELPGVTIKLN